MPLDDASRDLLLLHGDVDIFRSDPWSEIDTLMCQRGFGTVASSARLTSRGGWFYEVVLHSAGLAQIGWCSEGFGSALTDERGVGDDDRSCAFDGHRCVSSFLSFASLFFIE